MQKNRKKYCKVPEHLIKQIIELKGAGNTYTIIAKKTDIPVGTLSNIIQRYAPNLLNKRASQKIKSHEVLPGCFDVDDNQCWLTGGGRLLRTKY